MFCVANSKVKSISIVAKNTICLIAKKNCEIEFFL